jgi:protein involved in polysaccharide export with SLBB domain
MNSLCGRSRKLKLLLVALAMWAAPVASHAADAAPYLLVPDSRILVKTYQLNASKGEYVPWEALTGEFAVSQTGTITFPIIGDIQASSFDAEGLTAELVKRVESKVSLLNPPNVSVQVLEYPPIYVVGQVTNAGEYKFRPGMTVIQALALAGGRYRAVNLPAATDQFSLRGDMQAVQIQIVQAMARIARLQAEVSGSADITFPDELAQASSGSDANSAVEQERLIFANRKIALQRQLQALTDLKALYGDEINSLNDKAKELNGSITLNTNELNRISALVDKGVVVASRKMDLIREVADLRSKLLDNDIEELKARQYLADAIRTMANLQDQYAASSSADLQATTAALDQLRIKEKTLRNQSAAAGVSVPAGPNAQTALTYMIMRRGSKPAEMAADETTLVMPGDVLDVELKRAPD